MTPYIAFASFVGSLIGMGMLIGRHWNEAIAHDNASLMPQRENQFFLAHAFRFLRERSIVFWHTILRDLLYNGFEKTLTFLERALKRATAFLRLLRSAMRRRQLNGLNGEDTYWRHLNSWNSRRLKLRLRRRKSAEEHS